MLQNYYPWKKYRWEASRIESDLVVKAAIARFARELGNACMLQHSVVRVEPPQWEIHVSGCCKGHSLNRSAAAKDKLYYTLLCTQKLSGGSTGPASSESIRVHRRWKSLQGFFEDLRGLNKQINSMLSRDGAAGDDVPEFPKQPAAKGDRVRNLQDYFADWNRWDAALRERHSFAVTEICKVWEFLTLDVILE